MAISGYWRITRPVNSVVAGFAVLLGVIIATGSIELYTLILIPVVAMITAAGNVINDYCDSDIDRINRPDRPIPSGTVTPHGALAFSLILFLAGISVSYFANTLCFAIAIFNSVLLALYALKLKGLPLVGNIAISYLAGSIFLFGGAITGFEGLLQNIPIAGIAALAMLARELLKDAEDVEGDAEGGAVTLPIIIGIKKTGLLALFCASLGVLMSLLPLVRWWGPIYLVMIAVADIIILTGAYRGYSCETPDCLRTSGATGLIKTGMFGALLVFILCAVFL